MQIIDAHQHFWNPEDREYPWMDSARASLRTRFSPDDLGPQLQAAGVGGTVVVQAVGSLGESKDLLEVAGETGFVLGVVGWADLQSDRMPEQVDELRAGSGGQLLVGLRHQVENEAAAGWLRSGAAHANLGYLGRVGLAYDLLIRRDQLAAAVDVARQTPETRFVLDHLWKPSGRPEDGGPWSAGIVALAILPNVAVKLSGVVEGRPDVLRTYVDRALSEFGADRVIFGSDWPVSTLNASYGETVRTALEACDGLSPSEVEAVFAQNAREWYGL